MNLALKYDTQEELVQALEERIEQDPDGKFYLIDLKEKNDRLAQEVEQSKKYRQRAQDAEAKGRDYERQVATLSATVDELNQLNPLELQEKIKEYTLERANLITENEQLAATVDELQEVVLEYQRLEEEARIEEALLNAARLYGIRQEAYRDVLRLTAMFEINEEDEILSTDGLTVEEVVLREKELSPHWLPPSIGGGCRAESDGNHFDEFLSDINGSRNIATLLMNAPVIS